MGREDPVEEVEGFEEEDRELPAPVGRFASIAALLLPVGALVFADGAAVRAAFDEVAVEEEWARFDFE